MSIPSEEFPWADLGRWFANELPAKDAESLARWVAGDPERAAVVAALRDTWTASGAAGEGWDAAAALRRVRRAAAEETTVIARLGADQVAASHRRPSWIRPVLRIAAALVIAVGGTLLVLRPRVTPPMASAVRTEATDYRTARGQRLAFRLSDGTQVTLAPGSLLRRPADYGRRTRSLELDGEAYFVVAHDATRPFTVRTSRLTAHDLGTRFVVRAYPEDASADVLVAEGRVAVRQRDGTPAVLVRGQRARVDSSGRLLVESNVELATGLAWTDGQLVFQDAPLVDVGREFKRWYDVDIRLASPTLARLRVSGTFGNRPIEEELTTVAIALGLTVRQVEGRYELSRARP